MTAPADEDDEIVPEDWPTYYTQVPVWVLLADVPAQAFRLYAFLAEHINNRQPGRRISCPKQKAIARVLGLKKPQQVAPYAAALEALGAIRIDEYRYANGMRRGYRYHVRFNPPEGYVGLLSLGQFYEANPDVRAPASQGRVAAAKGESAGQPGGPKNGTSGGTKNGTAHGAKSGTAELHQEELDQEERDGAPSARSADDGRRPSTGSRGRARKGGSAASGKSKPRITSEQRRLLEAVLAYMPLALREHPKAPRDWAAVPVVQMEVFGALASGLPRERTVKQLGGRIGYRWSAHDWAGKLIDGVSIDKPVGVLVDLVRPYRDGDRYGCAEPRCENGRDIDTGRACPRCEERAAERRAQAAAERGEQQQEPAVAPQEVRVPVPAHLCRIPGPTRYVTPAELAELEAAFNRPLAVVDDSLAPDAECPGRDGMCGIPLKGRQQRIGLCALCEEDAMEVAAAGERELTHSAQ